MARVDRRSADMSVKNDKVTWLSPLLVVLLLAAVVVAFQPALGNAFLNWDDDRNFVENESYRGVGLEQLQWAWSTYHLGVWQPLAWILLGLEYVLFGLNPTGYHVTSLLLHAVNAVLVYVLAVFLLTRRPSDAGEPRWIVLASAWAAALVFAVHPLRVEPVAWVSCQPYLPAIFFYLLAVLVYLRGHARREKGNPHVPNSTRWRTLGATLGLFVLAIGFKAVAVSLPAVLLVLDWYPLGRWRKTLPDAAKLLIEKLPFLLVAVVASYWAMQAKDFTRSRAPFHECYPMERLAHASFGAWFYLLKTIWPANLIAFYRLPQDLTIGAPSAAGAALAIVGLTILLWRLRHRSRAPLAAWLCYLVILLPNIGLIQISQQLAADRYGELALIGPTLLLAELFRRFVKWRPAAGSWKKPLVVTTLAAVCLVLMLRARTQCLMWRDSETLWRSTLDVDPDCAVACCNLGEALVKKGQFSEASRHLSRAIEMDPRFSFAYANLGVVLCQARQFERAADFGEQALAVESGLTGLDLARTHAMLGQAYAGLRNDAQAWRHTRMARELGLVEAQKMLDYLSQFSKESPTDTKR